MSTASKICREGDLYLMDFYELFMLVIPSVESYNALEVGIPTYEHFEGKSFFRETRVSR